MQVKLSPKATQDRIGPVELHLDKAVLRVFVRAVPEKGRANKALCRLLAKEFSMAKSNFEVVGGAKSRHKTVLIRDGAEMLIPRIGKRLKLFGNPLGDSK